MIGIYMANPIEIYAGTTLLFRFNPAPNNITFNIQKTGNMPMDLPTFIRPWMYDFTSQNRTLSVQTAIMYLEPYTTKGTGTILDQIEDLLYIMSGNWWTTGATYLTLYVPYPNAMAASHDLSVLYPSTGNADYALDAGSVPASGADPVGGPTRAKADKKYYIYPTDMAVNRDEASVNRVRITISFMEVQEVVKI